MEVGLILDFPLCTFYFALCTFHFLLCSTFLIGPLRGGHALHHDRRVLRGAQTPARIRSRLRGVQEEDVHAHPWLVLKKVDSPVGNGKKQRQSTDYADCAEFVFKSVKPAESVDAPRQTWENQKILTRSKGEKKSLRIRTIRVIRVQKNVEPTRAFIRL